MEEHKKNAIEQVDKILTLYPFERMRSENTLVAHTYKTEEMLNTQQTAGTAIVGLLSERLQSLCCFHKLGYDEMWHFYSGSPFILYEMGADGVVVEHCMGNDVLNGQKPVHVVKKNTWQAARMIDGGEYALYGCTMAPGFIVSCFEEANQAQWLQKYPEYSELIKKLTVDKIDVQY